jgi:hypothetical protein
MTDYSESRFDPESLLNWQKAKTESSEGLGFTGDDVVTVVWEIPFGAVEECKAWLRSNRLGISNVDVDFKRLDGPWHISGIKAIPSKQRGSDKVDFVNLAVSYAKGYYISLDWTEARLGEAVFSVGNSTNAESIANTQSDNPEIYLTVIFPFIDPAYVESLSRGLATGSDISAVTLSDGTMLPGTYHVLSARPRQSDDGTYQVIAILSQPQFTIHTYADWGTFANAETYRLHDVPKAFVQTIITAWRTLHPKGAYASEDYDRGNKTSTINLAIRTPEDNEFTEDLTAINCRFHEYTSYYFGMESPFDVELPTSTTPGESYDKRVVARDGMFDIYVTNRVRQEQEREDDVVAIDEYSEETQTQRLGIAPTDLVALTRDDGTVVQRTIEILEDCALNVRDGVIEAQGVEDAAKRSTANVYESTESVTDRNQDEAGTLPTAADGKIFETQYEKNRFSKFDNTNVERSAVEVADARVSATEDTFEERASDTIRNKTTDARAPASANGVIQEVVVEKSEFLNRIHDTLNERTAKEVTGFRTSEVDDVFEKRESDTIRNSDAVARTPVSADGVIQESSVEKSEFPDRIHDTLNERTAHTVLDVVAEKTITVFETLDRDTDRNATEVVAEESAQTAGQIKTTRNEKSEFPDRYHTTEEVRIAATVEDAVTTESEDAFETRESDTIRNKSTAARTPASGSGVIQSVRIEKSEFKDRIHDTLDQRTATVVADFRTSEVDDVFEKRESDTIRNSDGVARTPASADGVIQEGVVEKSEFPDRIHDTLNQRTAHTVTDATLIESSTAYEEVARDTIRNATAARTGDVESAAGVIRTHTVEKSEFPSRVHDTIESRTAVEVTDAQTVETESAFETLERDTIRNSDAAARTPVSDDGVIQSVTIEKSEFKDRIHDTLETRTAVEVADFRKTLVDDVFEERASDTIRNSDDVARTPASADGVIQESNVEKSEFPDRIHDTLTKRTAHTVPDVVAEKTITVFETLDRDTDRNATEVVAEESAQTAGQIKTTRNEKSEFPGRYHTTEEIRIAATVEDAVTTESEDAFETRESDTIRNKSTAARTPASGSGVIQSVRIEKSEFKDRIHDTLEARTAVEVADFRVSEVDDVFEKRESDTIRNSDAVARTPASANGVIQESVVEQSEFPDRIHDTLNQRTAHTVTDATLIESSTAYEELSRDTIRNAAAARDVESAAGVIRTHTVEKSEFPSRVHDTVESRTAVEVAEAEKLNAENVFETREQVTSKSESVAETVGTLAAATTKQVIVRASEYPDRYDNVVDVRTAADVDDSRTAKEISLFETLEIDEKRTTATSHTAPESQAEGTIVRVEIEKTEFKDRVNSREVTRTANPVEDAVKVTSADAFSTSDVTIDRNAASPETPVTQITGNVIKTVRSEKNEFKKYDNSVQEEEGVEQTVAAFTSDIGEFVVRTTEKGFNKAALPGISSESHASLDGTMNRFELFDYAKQVVSPKAGVIGAYGSYVLWGPEFEEREPLVGATSFWEARWDNAEAAKRAKLGKFEADGDYANALDESDLDMFEYKQIGTTTKRYRWRYLHTIALHATMADAIAAIDGTSSFVETGSGYHQIAEGVWMSDKITKTKIEQI